MNDPKSKNPWYHVTRHPVTRPPSFIAFGIGLIVAGLTAQAESPAAKGYTFIKVTALGDPAPGPEGGFRAGDIEPYGLNDNGQVSFASDLTIGGEGVFTGTPGNIQQILREGEPAPGGGTFGGYGVLTYASLNNAGDLAFC